MKPLHLLTIALSITFSGTAYARQKPDTLTKPAALPKESTTATPVRPAIPAPSILSSDTSKKAAASKRDTIKINPEEKIFKAMKSVGHKPQSWRLKAHRLSSTKNTKVKPGQPAKRSTSITNRGTIISTPGEAAFTSRKKRSETSRNARARNILRAPQVLPPGTV